jgi:uncharacterized protein (DUF2336 family)
MSYSQALIVELDAALGPEPGERSATILQRVADLYLTGVGAYTDEQVSVFDDVMLRLTEMVDRNALAELSGRLAPLKVAPRNTLLRLWNDTDRAVFGPVLEFSNISEKELVARAKAADEQTLALIARRAHLPSAVSDILLERNLQKFARGILANPDAQISDASFVRMIGEAAKDSELAKMIVDRSDLPGELRPFLDAYLPKPPAGEQPAAEEQPA